MGTAPGREAVHGATDLRRASTLGAARFPPVSGAAPSWLRSPLGGSWRAVRSALVELLENGDLQVTGRLEPRVERAPRRLARTRHELRAGVDERRRRPLAVVDLEGEAQA